jgi:hypothetical protein
MGRFWRCFFASFCLMRKVLWDGCEGERNGVSEQLKPYTRGSNSMEDEEEIVRYHRCGGDEDALRRRRRRQNPRSVKC